MADAVSQETLFGVRASEQVTGNLLNSNGRKPTGVLPAQEVKALVRDKSIIALESIEQDQYQPSSLDLRLGSKAYRIRASFLPGNKRTVEDALNLVFMHEIDLSEGAVLETGCVYLVPLMERLALPQRVSGAANPKSSTGRLDVFTRLITDEANAFDRIKQGYKGPLYAEISPKTFSIFVRAGSRLNQLRLRRGTPRFVDANLKRLHEEIGLIDTQGDIDIDQGIALSIDLKGEAGSELVGYRAKRHAGMIDVDKLGAYDPMDYWERIYTRGNSTIVLDPDEFYILVSKEAVTVPPDHAAEMVPFNPLMGEFRVHYAGFFDPGFGYSEDGGAGSRAVLEVRSHDVPFILEDGQIVGRLIYERLTAKPDFIYGQDIGSHYQRQGLKLSKHFKTG